MSFLLLKVVLMLFSPLSTNNQKLELSCYLAYLPLCGTCHAPAVEGTLLLLCMSCACQGSNRPSNIRGPIKSRSIPTQRPAAARQSGCAHPRQRKRGSKKGSRCILNACKLLVKSEGIHMKGSNAYFLDKLPIESCTGTCMWYICGWHAHQASRVFQSIQVDGLEQVVSGCTACRAPACQGPGRFEAMCAI